MNNHILKLAGAVIACAVISACSSSDVSTPPVPPLNSGTPSSGTADFSKFVSIGDSLTAGYADGALYLLGQQNSFPKTLSQQFAEVGGGVFTQPLASDNLGGLLFNNVANPDFDNRLALNTETQKPERLTGTPATEVFGSGLNGTSFNNMGVPGAKSYHLGAPGYGATAGLLVTPPTANPYFVRFSLDFTSASETVIGDAAGQLPSFFTLWIGNNDVLSYATSGGVGAASCDPLTTTCSDKDITDTAAFATVYAQLVGALTTGANINAKGVLINIPDVSTIPFFTTVPYNAVPLDQATADNLNTAYAAYNAAISNPAFGLPADEIAKRTISFSAGQNAVVIEDETLTSLTGFDPALLSMRQATAADLILLPASAYIGTENPNSVGTTPPAGKPWGVAMPLADSDVLIPSEISAINTARLAFNQTIKVTADASLNLVYLDAAAIMTQLSTTGINYGSGSINADFATGGAFSLDGVHPTARGYAVIANSIIDVINSNFSANVYKVDPALYPTIFLK